MPNLPHIKFPDFELPMRVRNMIFPGPSSTPKKAPRGKGKTKKNSSASASESSQGMSPSSRVVEPSETQKNLMAELVSRYYPQICGVFLVAFSCSDQRQLFQDQNVSFWMWNFHRGDNEIDLDSTKVIPSSQSSV